MAMEEEAPGVVEEAQADQEVNCEEVAAYHSVMGGYDALAFRDVLKHPAEVPGGAVDADACREDSLAVVEVEAEDR